MEIDLRLRQVVTGSSGASNSKSLIARSHWKAPKTM